MSDYDTDFYAWTQAQAAALRAKDVAVLDLDNLAEEIESLGERDRRSVHGRLKVLPLPLCWKIMRAWRRQDPTFVPSRFHVEFAEARQRRLQRAQRWFAKS